MHTSHSYGDLEECQGRLCIMPWGLPEPKWHKAQSLLKVEWHLLLSACVLSNMRYSETWLEFVYDVECSNGRRKVSPKSQLSPCHCVKSVWMVEKKCSNSDRTLFCHCSASSSFFFLASSSREIFEVSSANSVAWGETFSLDLDGTFFIPQTLRFFLVSKPLSRLFFKFVCNWPSVLGSSCGSQTAVAV